MNKFGFIIAIAAILVFTGCASSGGSGSGGGDLSPYIVDLSNIIVVPEEGDAANPDEQYPGTRNTVPLDRRWRWFVTLLGDLPENITDYQRVTIRVKYFDENGDEIAQADDRVQVTMFYELSTESGAPELHRDGHPNHVLKEMNVGGFSGIVSTDRGVRVRLRQAPAGIVLQCASAEVKFIELTEVVFHNGNYTSN